MLILVWLTGELFNENRYIENDLQFRLAFRDFGTCLGIGCISGKESINDDIVDLKIRSDEIMTQWQKHISSSLTPEDLRPITRVMYASALIPGGE